MMCTVMMLTMNVAFLSFSLESRGREREREREHKDSIGTVTIKLCVDLVYLV